MPGDWDAPDADSVRSLAWNRLSDYPDAAFGKDFISVVDRSAQWRVSTVARDHILIRDRQSISTDTAAEGRP